MRFLQAAFGVFLASSIVLSSTSLAADAETQPQIVFTNVNIFNGTDNRLYEDHQVLIEGNLIKAIFTQAKGGPMYEASVGGQKFKVEAK